MRYDVIVAGAGPAGSTAARECASRGLSVLLLDKAEFPRDKPCGGGVNVRAARLLPFDLHSVAERLIYGMRISVRQTSTFTRYSPEPITYLTQRRWLDTFLLEQAVGAGATLRERTPVKAVEQFDGHVVVRAGAEIFAGRTLVVADGANGPTARAAGVTVPRFMGIALEGNFTPKDKFPEEWQDAFGLDVGDVPRGYGWIFPKGDHLNIGVGGWHNIGPSLRRRLDRLVRFYGFDSKELWGLRGHPLPVRQYRAPVADGNAVLVGDAAGLVDPLTGEGIYSAICSGQIAARHIAAYVEGHVSNLKGYADGLARELLPDLDVSCQLHDLYHLYPPAWAALIRRSPYAWGLVCRLMRGDQTFAGAKAKYRALGLTVDALSDVVRLAKRLRHPADAAEVPAPEHFLRAFA